MSLTILEKQELIRGMSLACYTLGEVYTQLALKLRLNYGQEHEEAVKPTEIWVKPGIREILP